VAVIDKSEIMIKIQREGLPFCSGLNYCSSEIIMCGIFGGVFPHNPISLEPMAKALHHRGPDDMGLECLVVGNRCITLGSTRLSILDTSSAGHMPMNDPETGNWIVFNGEVYNFREIRSRLERLGHVFRSTGDTEVVLKAYSQWGINCIKFFRGMFAFCIWDARRKELLLARDHLGEKPLYYCQPQNKCFLFSSEVRALLASDVVERRLDKTSLHVLLYNGFTIAPRTIIQGVYSLLPGQWMRVDLDGQVLDICTYWRPPVFVSGEDQSTSVEDLRQELAKATLLRMHSDVQLGAFLSGGLDSSIIVALMHKFVKEVRTFSIGFTDKQHDESKYAEAVARQYCTNHTTVILRTEDLKGWIDPYLDAMDQPSFDGMNMYIVSKVAREHGLTVAISGIGGDELFGGYLFFRSVPIIDKISYMKRFLSQKLSGMIVNLGKPYGVFKLLHMFDQHIPSNLEILAAYQACQALFPINVQRKLFEADLQSNLPWFGLPSELLKFIENLDQDDDKISRISHYAIRIFLGERILRDTDNMSMGNSIEVRSVFTDHVFIEKTLKIAGSVRCRGAPHKPFERELALPILGKEYLYRHKKGFILPFRSWIKEVTSRSLLYDTILDRHVHHRIGFRSEEVDKMLVKSSLPWSRIWLLYVLARWITKYGVSI